LHRGGLAPDHVVSSPARRARETTLLVCKALGFAKERVTWDDRLYPGGLSGLLAALAGCPERATRVMLVGHNPGLETLVRYLARESVDAPADGKLLPTAAVACLDMPKTWNNLVEHSGRLVAISRPRAIGGQA
jgi:phosphohistidine phosphatase